MDQYDLPLNGGPFVDQWGQPLPGYVQVNPLGPYLVDQWGQPIPQGPAQQIFTGYDGVVTVIAVSYGDELAATATPVSSAISMIPVASAPLATGGSERPAETASPAASFDSFGEFASQTAGLSAVTAAPMITGLPRASASPVWSAVSLQSNDVEFASPVASWAVRSSALPMSVDVSLGPDVAPDNSALKATPAVSKATVSGTWTLAAPMPASTFATVVRA
jgi:hypothetical protein